MSKYAEYKNKQRDVFLQQERTTQLEKEGQIGGDYDYSGQELIEQFKERQNEGNIKDRTKYYFEEEGLMEAKATRYRTMATHGDAITQYSRKYTNHSASKRKKSARKAADGFDRVAALERQYAGENADSVTSLKHKEEIIRARIEAMGKAAEVKSRSKQNESYRKLKAKISGLTILKEQADDLLNKEKNEQLKQRLTKETTRISKELSGAQNEIMKMTVPVTRQWEKSIGIPEKVSEKRKQFQRINPEIDTESTETIMKLKALTTSQTEQGAEVLRGLEKSGMYPGYKFRSGDDTRLLNFSMRVVLRDENGLPLNKAELKKDEQNKKWMNALKTGNVEDKNAILLDTMHRIETMHIPSPRELMERGSAYYVKDVLPEFIEIQRMTLCFDKIKENDPFVKEYLRNNPQIQQKINVAAAFMTTVSIMILRDYFAQQGYESGDNSGYAIAKQSRGSLKSTYNKNMISMLLEEYGQKYNDFFDSKGLRHDAQAKQNDRQKEASDSFLKDHPDEYDKKMRQQIDNPAQSELSKDLLYLQDPEELSVLTGNTFDKVIGGNLSKSQKLKRAENSIEKKKLQADLRNGLEDFLAGRQINIGIGLEQDYYSFHRRTNEVERNEDKKIIRGKIDNRFLKFALDWANYKNTGMDGIIIMVDDFGAKSSISEQVKNSGNTLINLDLSMFEYKSDEEFVSKLKNNYMWLNRAESLEEAYRHLKSDGLISSDKKIALSRLEGRLNVLRELKADYDARIAMMNSPYYALLAQSDLKTLSDEELEKKQTAAEAEDMELFEFLKNYRFLNRKNPAFSKGQKVAASLEEKLSEEPKKAVAEDIKRRLSDISRLGLEKADDESDEDYEKRMITILEEKVSENIPSDIDANYLSTVKPFMFFRLGALEGNDILKLEAWINDNLSHEATLKEKGLKDSEIEKLRKYRELSIEARRAVDAQEYVNKEWGLAWENKFLEKPSDNDMIDKSVYDKVNTAYSTFQKISSKIGVPKKFKRGAEPAYIDNINRITDILNDHNILYNKDVEEKIEKAKAEQKVIFEKNIADGQETLVTIGSKTYHLPKEMLYMSEFNGKGVDLENEALLDEKMTRALDLFYRGAGERSLSDFADNGEYGFEYMRLNVNNNKKIAALYDEIKKLIK